MLETLSAADRTAIREAAAEAPGLRLLVLHGSRARADARLDSDWDFAYLADTTFDPDALLAYLASRLRADRIDLADLRTASGQLRYRVARDGVTLYARPAGEWERFWMDAVSFWCDAAPVLGAAYDGALSELAR
ncbi:MAG: nucleotidyltransferase domain-containing protein [Acidobacteriota bacterium]